MSTKTFLCLFALLLLAVLAQASSFDEDYITSINENTNDVSIYVTTESSADFMNEAFWRKLANYTRGIECQNRLRGKADFLTNFCVCLLICPHRELEQWEKEEHKEIMKVLRAAGTKSIVSKNWHFIIPYSIISFVGGIGNLLILVILHKFMPKRSVVNVMVTSLAVADLMVCLFTSPLEANKAYYRHWILKPIGCYIFQFTYYLTMAASILTLTAMSAERYLVICQPMKAQSLVTYSRAQKAAIFIWLLAAALCSPMMFATRTFDGDPGVCKLLAAVRTGYLMLYFAAALFVFPSAVMVIFYFQTGRALYRSVAMQRHLAGKGEENEKKQDNKAGEGTNERIQVMRMLVAVAVIFIVCWGPALVFQAAFRMSYDPQYLYDFPQDPDTAQATVRYLFILAYANSAINPIIYFLTSKQFRRGLYKLLGTVCICCKSTWQQKEHDLAPSSVQSTKQSNIMSST